MIRAALAGAAAIAVGVWLGLIAVLVHDLAPTGATVLGHQLLGL